MRKSVLVLLIAINISSYAQNLNDSIHGDGVYQKILDSKANPVDIRFKDKETGLVRFLYQNLKYPENSIKNKSVGHSIIGITITPYGTIKEILTINPIDEEIGNDISGVLSKTKDKWLKSDTAKTDETFYFQVLYRIKMFGIKNEPYKPKVGIFI